MKTKRNLEKFFTWSEPTDLFFCLKCPFDKQEEYVWLSKLGELEQLATHGKTLEYRRYSRAVNGLSCSDILTRCTNNGIFVRYRVRLRVDAVKYTSTKINKVQVIRPEDNMFFVLPFEDYKYLKGRKRGPLRLSVGLSIERKG